MQELTNKEFWVLHRHRKGKPFVLPMSKADYLLSFGYLTLTEEKVKDPKKLGIRFKVAVTREGCRACERHGDKYFTARRASVRAWIALIISGMSALFTLLEFTLK